ncbi:MAG: ABC transporter ATP-binding protein [Clostridia bacterium]|nr:ABC transporter ATP-binding protein [Clostridia bacterium]
MSDIILKNISKAYDGKQVLNHFSLTLPEGKRTCIMGPSGCGKTTLLNILCGLQKADEGEIRNLPGKISVVFQENRLCEQFTALENVRMVAPEKTETAKDILASLGLVNDLYQKAASLSGGMKRRVAIARALCFDAPLVVMDEPFKGLDEETKETVMETVMQMTEGKTVLIITHDEQEARRFADHIVIMQEH